MWLPLYPKARFIRPIRENLQKLLAANEAASLAWASEGGETLTAYKEYRKALWYNTYWPIMSVVSQTTEKAGKGDEVLPQKHSILIEIEDAGSNPDVLVDTIERRIAAADMIITSADPNLLKTGLDPEHIAINDLWASSHDYSQFTRGQNFYLQVGSLMVTVETIEA
jgi:hypothetical protein